MNDQLRFEIWTATPPLGSYLPDSSLREGYGLTGNWPGCVLTGASGKRYFFMVTIGATGTPEFAVINNMNVIEHQSLAATAPSVLDGVELLTPFPISATSDGSTVHYELGEAGTIDFTPATYRWKGFRGRVDLTVDQQGQAVYYRIPEQPGVTMGVLHQSQVGAVTGTIDGDPVTGMSLTDLAWGSPGASWLDLEVFTGIQKHWTMWICKYTDGTFDGGYAWRSKPGYSFHIGHLIRDGRSTADQTTITTPTFAESGVPKQMRIEYGDEYTVELSYDCMADWPMHPIGKVDSTTATVEGGRQIEWSQTMTEWIPDNIAELIRKAANGDEGLTMATLSTHPSKIVDGDLVDNASGDDR